MPKTLFPAADAETRARLERSEMLRLVNGFDWDNNPLGSIRDWPESLKGAMRMALVAETPMVLMVGPQGILVYNDSYARFAGRRHPEIFGVPVEAAWPEIAEFNRHKLALGLAGQSLVLVDQELVLDRHGTPESGWMNLHYSPVLDADGTPLAVLVVVQETTERVLAERALARSEERLSLALAGSSLVGTWDWNVRTDTVTADDRFARLYRLDPLKAGLGLPISDFLAAIHPDDRKRVQSEIVAAMEDDVYYRSEYRLVQEDGSIVWVLASGKPRRDAEGNVVRFPGIAVDISEQKRTAEALAESEMRFRTLADAMPQMVWSTLPDGYHDYYNARWYEFTGVPPGTTDGEGWNDMFHPEDRERAWEVWRHSLATGEPYKIEYRLRHHSGAWLWTLGAALPLRNAQGEIVRWIGTCTDIHQTKIAAQERELVAQELSHRIKNIFAVMTGIISLSARTHPEARPFADQLRERIFALGEAHNFVQPRSGALVVEGNSLHGLVARLMAPYGQDGSRRLVLTGEDAEIDEGAATPLALLFHELATNAAKYGALSVTGGVVELDGRHDGDRYRIVWKERGGPHEDAPADRQGFGSRLIALAVEGQLRGAIERHWETDGLRIELALPLASLQKSGRLKSSDRAPSQKAAGAAEG